MVTGASSGIGLAAARELARLGARIALVCRDRERAERALAEVAAGGGDGHTLHLADLSAQAEVRKLAQALLAACPRIDVLLNNAGIVSLRRQTTVDGLESVFATNHLAPFLLTSLLLPRLRESAPARIVNVSSHAHRMAQLDFDDLQNERRYRFMRVYGSKLCNLLFTRELARRLEGTGVSVNALHPGMVHTGLGRQHGRLADWIWLLLRPLARTPEQGADTAVHLASAPELQKVSGRYYTDRRETAPSEAALDDAAAARLWAKSEAPTGLST